MTIQDFVSLSGEILTQYYDNNITPFLDACHEDVLWIGPAEKQVIRTKKVLVNTFLSEQHKLKFVLHDLVITPLATTSNRVVEIIMFFMVDTIWPDNSMNRVNQRIHLSWIMNNEVPQIRLCHISNAISYDERDTIYPVHYDSKFRGMPLAGVSRSERLSFKGTDKSLLFLNRNPVHRIPWQTLQYPYNLQFLRDYRKSAFSGKTLPGLFPALPPELFDQS